MSDTKNLTQEASQAEQLRKVGSNAMESIRDMVAALECDYDRLDELRDERDSWEPADGKEFLRGWREANPTEAEELKELEEAAGDCESRDDAETRIQEDPLSLEYRSGWTLPGDKMEAEEFCLLLSTGGPAVRIVGEIRNGEAYRPRLEVQDWYTPWTEYQTDSDDDDALLTYCNTVGVGVGIEIE